MHRCLSKKHEVVALGLICGGFTLEAFAQIRAQSGLLHGAGVAVFFVGMAVELVGFAIYENEKNDE